MVNCIFIGKAIALTSENNQKVVEEAITKKFYINVFTSPEIALSKKFRANVFDNPRFVIRFLLLVIDEIYLIEK